MLLRFVFLCVLVLIVGWSKQCFLPRVLPSVNKEFHHTKKSTDPPVPSSLSGFSQSAPPISIFQKIGVLLPIPDEAHGEATI
jgi:hypothetical protein